MVVVLLGGARLSQMDLWDHGLPLEEKCEAVIGEKFRCVFATCEQTASMKRSELLDQADLTKSNAMIYLERLSHVIARGPLSMATA